MSTNLLLQLANDLEYFYETQQFSDFAIIIDDVVIKVHKFVLCARNKVLADLIQANDLVKKVELCDVDPEAFKVFIKYLYTSKIQKNDVSQNLRFIAKQYLDINLKDFCENHLSVSGKFYKHYSFYIKYHTYIF